MKYYLIDNWNRKLTLVSQNLKNPTYAVLRNMDIGIFSLYEAKIYTKTFNNSKNLNNSLKPISIKVYEEI